MFIDVDNTNDDSRFTRQIAKGKKTKKKLIFNPRVK